MLCNSCDCVFVNGHKCHELGCPESYKDQIRTCKWCGQEFEPEDSNQICCNDECYQNYRGY